MLNKETIKKATALYKKGYAIKDIAMKIGKSVNTTSQILVDSGLHKVNSPLLKEDREKIISLLLEGEKVSDVAKLFDVSDDYVRKLAYRTNVSYSVLNDKLVINDRRSKAKQLEVRQEEVKQEEVTTEDMTVSFIGKEKDCITTILLDALIKSEEGSEILRRKGFKPVMQEIESAVEAILN